MGAAPPKQSKNNFETFPLIWLDATVNDSQENANAQDQLRTLSNHLMTFTDSYQCEQYIRSLSASDQIIFMVSSHLGREFIPRIHHLPQISSIYVYCMNEVRNEHLANQFTKVKYTLSSQ